MKGNDASRYKADTPGQKPIFFFAPAWIAKRLEQWGGMAEMMKSSSRRLLIVCCRIARLAPGSVVRGTRCRRRRRSPSAGQRAGCAAIRGARGFNAVVKAQALSSELWCISFRIVRIVFVRSLLVHYHRNPDRIPFDTCAIFKCPMSPSKRAETLPVAPFTVK